MPALLESDSWDWEPPLPAPPKVPAPVVSAAPVPLEPPLVEVAVADEVMLTRVGFLAPHGLSSLHHC